jgi:cytochrome o ubiquinol oxidase subunit I
MFGKLTLAAFKHELSQNLAVIMMILTGIFLIGLISYLKKWKWLWKEWLISLDPKRIGIMYLIVALLLFFKGFMDAFMMRVQQVMSVGDSQGFISADHFQEVFSAHGTTMIFFVGMGIVFGLMNLVIPLQIGARDVAFPFLNSVSFWLFASAATLTLVSLAIGKFSGAGWLAYPPLSAIDYSPDEGVDYWIWIVQIAGIGSTLAGINFFVTILKLRCKGMTPFKMPIFVWSCLGALILVIFAFPILTATLGMLTIDRNLGTHFFTAGSGGNAMMYINLVWAWGHPEVYILILPAFGIFSEVVPTFCEKRLFGYISMVWAIILIAFYSFVVWLHHFFTMGAGPVVNSVFGILTMVIAIPTGVKVFNWLFTKFRGRVHFTTPMLWFFAFILNFTVAGMTGVLLSAPPVDYEVHNSLFLIAHFHGMVIGSMLFAMFAALAYWFPKMTGFMLNEKIGIYAFWCWFVGFLVAFMPLYMLGFMGATRRLDHYQLDTGWRPLFIVAAIGAVFIFCGVLLQGLQIYVSIRDRKKHRDLNGDPWNGRTLEWSTSSPPPVYNFAIQPTVNQRDPFWAFKRGEVPLSDTVIYEDIYIPKDSSIPVYIGMFALIFGFAFTWHIWWAVALSFAGITALVITRLSQIEEFEVIPAEEVAKTEEIRTTRQKYA